MICSITMEQENRRANIAPQLTTPSIVQDNLSFTHSQRSRAAMSTLSRKMQILCLICILLCSLVPSPGHTLFWRLDYNRSLEDLIYKRHLLDSDTSSAFCIGRLNRTHHFGCHNAPHSVQYGVPYLVNSSHSIDTIMGELKAFGTHLVLLIDIFHFEWIAHFRVKLSELDQTVAGVIFYNRDGREFPPKGNTAYKSYSHDSVCPGSSYGVYENPSTFRQCQKQWVSTENPFLDFAHTKWPFPIFYVRNRTLLDDLFECYQSNGGLLKADDCVVQLKLNLYGAINSVRCMARSKPLMDILLHRSTTYCSKIWATSMFTPLIPVEGNSTVKNLTDRSVIVLTARIDSLTAFEQFSPGANSVYSGLIVFFTIVHLLGKHREHIGHKTANSSGLNNILYALFDGESFGYLGSSSWLYYNNFHENGTAIKNSFISHFKHNKLGLVLELNQLLTKDGKYWAHGGNQTDPKTEDYIKRLIKQSITKGANVAPSGSLSIERATSRELPPCSARVFKQLDGNISTILLAGYDSQIGDPFFHSYFDTARPKKIDSYVNKLAELAHHLAQFLFSLLTGENGAIKEDKEFVRSLAICFFQFNTSCHLFDGKLVLTDIPFNFTTPVRSANIRIQDMSVKKPTIRTSRYSSLRDALKQVLIYANRLQSVCAQNTSDPSPYLNMKTITPMNETAEVNTTEPIQCSQMFYYEQDTPYFDYLFSETDPRQWLNENLHFEFSTVVESYYETDNQPSVLIFKRPRLLYQICVLLLGIVVLVLSFVVTCFISARSEKLFEKGQLVVSKKKSNATKTSKDGAVPVEKSKTDKSATPTSRDRPTPSGTTPKQ